MADHSELIAELGQIEKMSTEERMKHARKRRVQQMKKWSQREKEYLRDTQRKKKKMTMESTNNKKNNTSSPPELELNVHFVPSVMLLEAAARGDVEEVQRLLMLGFDADSTNEDGLTALHQCCIDNNEDMMKLLLEFGANVNAEDSEKWTPLHAAATCGHLNLVKYLISKGANLLAVNADGNMPYDICEDETTLDYIETEMSKRGVTQDLIDETRSGLERLMLDDLKWIAQQNGDLEYRDHQNATPLHIAAANGYVSVVEFLLDQIVSIDAVDDDLWQAIHAAACWGHLEVLEMLVQNGASLDAKNRNGETPFDICEDLEMKERILQLKDEMEVKKSVQTHRLRRSQSQNTRSQSVRRTSLRDKNHMTRKEAREEAKIRMVHQGIQQNPEQSQLDLENGKENVEKNISLSSVDRDRICVSIDGKQKLVMPVQPFPRVSDGDGIVEPANLSHSTKDNVVNSGEHTTVALKVRDDEQKEIVNRNGNGVVPNSHWDEPKSASSPSSSPVRNSGSKTPRDVTLDLSIHVTVNATPTTNGNNTTATSVGSGNNYHNLPPLNNASTLAELKRQRNDTRKRYCNSVSSIELTQLADDVVMNGHGLETNHVGTSDFSPLSSPAMSRKKFTASNIEVIGASQKHRCCRCVIM